LCTCVWSTSSQALFQHGLPNSFWHGLLLSTAPQRPLHLLAGLSFSGRGLQANDNTRPAAVVLMLGLRDRRAMVRFLAGALPVAVLLVLYGLVLFDNPFPPARLAKAPHCHDENWQPRLCKHRSISAPWDCLSVLLAACCVFASAVVAVWAWSVCGATASNIISKRFRSRRWYVRACCEVVRLVGGWCYGYRPLSTSSSCSPFLPCSRAMDLRSNTSVVVVSILVCWSCFVQIVAPML